jgi:hypothetical protein
MESLIDRTDAAAMALIGESSEDEAPLQALGLGRPCSPTIPSRND